MVVIGNWLEMNGFLCMFIVCEMGEYVVCGGIVDFFVLGEEELVWLDFFGDIFELICLFNLEI